ncbi:hydroxyacylglutathione hydrolase [Shimia sp.]|jgi:hydroxyacylglutathione hydrolase|uniref:hydroxyacylglutathione hydrolase n=1 Tax=unclassified Shimia TaxID=2630038 RepID=UPI0025F49C45|nr:hydroxyacylglutathione hydrolase [Shimia sp.]MCH2065758.1 hydroxyacylglutathione hydrolase [Shimia sp.]
MPHQIVTIPCLSDNYAFLIHDAASGATALVDAPEPGPILDELKARGWTLSHVLLTHHHWDHVDGLPDILDAHPAKVIGAKADAHRLPALDLAVSEGETFDFADETVSILDVSGHTVGHIAFHFPDTAAVFTGDSLMAMGCGRLFEGSPAQMFASLSKLAALPDATTVCSGHEYTASNGAFAASLGEDNAAVAQRISDTTDMRAKGIATVPSNLGLEKQTNPFLRSADPALQKALGMEGAAPVDVFTEVRKRKDNF